MREICRVEREGEMQMERKTNWNVSLKLISSIKAIWTWFSRQPD